MRTSGNRLSPRYWLKFSGSLADPTLTKSFKLETGISFSVQIYSCLCNESYDGESIRHLDIRFVEHIDVSPLTGKQIKPISNGAVRDHLLHYNYLSSFDSFSILAHESKKISIRI